ncbi:type IV secretion protein Rhs [Arenicella chitinivorans]|uniref:Type IV secretion protein Rhs n=1 Tax=Arenicella chitinivorans TaxID=1329800 RepID=A0A918S358_9GAMM|nr:RHS repeat-associated core domain-containing protein [Arenicella chitinivorans]GHA19348.1 type IV secretion protein Rhs [Arenicella chitinivorans]
MDNGDKTHGSCGTTGNPCNPASGNKFESEVDLARGSLGFTRYYNSTNLVDLGMGKGWRHTYLKRLALNGTSLSVISESGRGELWTENGGVWQGDADSKVALVENASGFQLTRPNGNVENYDTFGRLASTLSTQGEQTSYQYGIGGYLSQVTDHDGNSLSFEYVGGMLSAVSDGDDATYRYEYDANRNLTAVIFPDETPGNDADNPRKIYHYEDTNFPNHLTGITDENGDRFGTYSYAVDGKVISSEHSVTSNLVGQERIDLTYQAGGTLVTDAAGTNVLWTFQDVLGASKITAKTNQTDNKGITQVWDSNGNLTSRTDAENRVTTYGYNATNQKTSMTEAYGTPQARTTTYEYVSADIDLVTKVITPSVYGSNFKEVVTSYDTNLNVTAVTTNGYDLQGNPVTRATTFQHDTYGKVTQIDGPRTDVSDITTLEYYNCTTGAECGQLKKVTNALGHETTYDLYDAAARLKQMTDANGVVTTYDYHPRGWVLSVTQTPPSNGQDAPSPRVTTYEYDFVGQLKKTTMPNGVETYYDYDAAHDLREVRDNYGNKITYTYDAKGNRETEQYFDPSGTLERTTTTAYDMRNFVSSINSGGSITQMVNDAVGNTVTLTDPNVNPDTTHNFDPLNRLTSTIDALTNSSGYDYDVADQLTQVVASNGATTDYEYDDLGNLVTEVSPDRGTITYTHDAAGNVLSVTDARSITKTYAYDALNRLVSVTYPDTTESVSFAYDACAAGTGRLCTRTDQSGSYTYGYDAYGNVTHESRTELGVTYTTSYTYDANNLLQGIVYPDGREVEYHRDAAGRVTRLATKVGATAWADVFDVQTYRADGLITGRTYANGLVSTRGYDLQGRLESIDIGTLVQRTYQYDANGNLTDRSPGNVVYGYDVLDRITSEDNLDLLSWTYDANGNRLSEDENSQLSLLTYHTNTNRLQTVATTVYNLDAAGNTTDDGIRTYTYNDAGRMETISQSGQLVATYTYNALGQRTRKVLASTQATTLYHYDLAGYLIGESDETGQFSAGYIHSDGQPIAVYKHADALSSQPGDGDGDGSGESPVDPPEEEEPGTTPPAYAPTDALEGLYYIHTDHLLTPRWVSDENAQLIWTWDSSAFGNTAPNDDVDLDGVALTLNMRFPGQYYDAESGLFYNWNRYYDAGLGRYVTSDPIGIGGGANTYGYVGGNPLAYFDPLGLEIVGSWKKYPTPFNISLTISNFTLNVNLFDTQLVNVGFSASANLHFVIGCRDTCSGKLWELDSGNRGIATSGNVDIPPPSIGFPCALIKEPRAKAACKLSKAKKYSEWARKSDELAKSRAFQIARRNFDVIADGIAAAIDPNNWCRTMPRP